MTQWPNRQAMLRTSRTPHSRSAVKLASMLLLGICFTAAPAMPKTTPVSEADAPCARCHMKIFREYLSTPMANASGQAIENLKAVTYFHRPSGATYIISGSNGQATLTSRDMHAPAGPVHWPLTYFLGSGHLGVTYLYFMNDYLFESPVAWYAATGGYDMKPGLSDVRQIPPAIPVQSACLRCHMSAVQASLPGTINRYRGLPFLHTGITCESCHGDPGDHLRSGGKAPIVNPTHLDADGRDSVCISCHLEGDVSVERAGKSPLNYRPGESISTYLAYYIRSSQNLRTRGVSEVEQLSQSTCKRISGDKMSCMSCHDPHFTPGPDKRVAFYRGKCLACHAEPAFAASHHPENQDCTSCHMQRTGAENIPHVAWTDHRILRLPESTSPLAHQTGGGELVPIFSPNSTKRDLAMAEYKLLLEGDQSFEGTAWEQLTQLGDSIANDKEALDARGNMSAERGDLHGAEQAFWRVLALDPADLTALSNLGILLAKQGNLPQATQLLNRAFDNNNNISGLAMNLARVECAAGDAAAARATLQTALVYSPGLEDLRRLQEHIKDQTSDCATPGKKQE